MLLRWHADGGEVRRGLAVGLREARHGRLYLPAEDPTASRKRMLRGMAILAAVAMLPQSHSSMNVQIDGTSDPSSAHARAPSPRSLEPSDTKTLSHLQLREELFKSLHVTEQARAHLAGLEQVNRATPVCMISMHPSVQACARVECGAKPGYSDCIIEPLTLDVRG